MLAGSVDSHPTFRKPRDPEGTGASKLLYSMGRGESEFLFIVDYGGMPC